MPRERPVDVLPHQRGRIVFSRVQRRQYLSRSRCVPQAYGEVSQPALITDAPDGRTLHALVELGLGPREQLDQRGAIQAVAHLEVLLVRGLREAVPRADRLAVVAAVNPIADERPQLLGNRALVLDGEV